jgi:hypothetical protein
VGMRVSEHSEELAVHHFNVPVASDILDRFIAVHYTDWELLNGRNINNVAEPRPTSRHFVTTGGGSQPGLINTEYFYSAQ